MALAHWIMHYWAANIPAVEAAIDSPRILPKMKWNLLAFTMNCIAWINGYGWHGDRNPKFVKDAMEYKEEKKHGKV